jgi:hypothetical protein
MQEIKFRLVNPGLKPRRTTLEMPGWAGKPEPRKDGSHEHAWHCMPFTEGAQYGIEIFYPYDNELHVTKKNGQFIFDGDFGAPPENDLQWPPFRSFGREYYTYQLLLDLKVGKDWAVRTEPHPRFYTDTTGTVPIAVPALLRTEWWPMISFVVFKSPAESETHIFRPSEPMLQILILPVTADFALVPMDDEEAAEREMRGRRIHASRETLAADSTWLSSTDTSSTAPTAIFFAPPRRRQMRDSFIKKTRTHPPSAPSSINPSSGGGNGGDDGDGADSAATSDGDDGGGAERAASGRLSACRPLAHPRS